MVISKETTEGDLAAKMQEFKQILATGKQVVLVARKGALDFDGKVKYENENTMVCEDIIRHIVGHTGDDSIVSTTGKSSVNCSRYARCGESHERYFLTVGSMGHASSIVLGIVV